ncbi:MAG: hypothetical protein K6G64_01885 [Eubacterium sp.]|nr:hypothetical protein [Eubacterium sp.]
MTEEKKIKIGLILNKVCTVLAVLFFLVTCVVMTLVKFQVYLILVISIAVLFGICSVTSHFLLKDYKPEK